MRTRIPIKSPKEIERMRESGRIAAGILQQLAATVAPGVTTGEIDKLATAGVTKGCNPPANDRFCPTSYVTRGQFAAFLYRAFN